jgi:hypothetical protein
MVMSRSSVRRLAATTLSAALITLTALTAGCGSTLNSTTWVPPGQTFLLGGGTVGDYTVSGTNSGQTDVEILSEQDGTTTTVARLKPGASISHTFTDGQLARFRNLSATDQAELTLVVKGQISSLGMRYQEK